MKVAVAIIFDAQGRILITRRALEASHGGQWEFPGGKLETGETAVMALVREIREEVNLKIIDSDFLGEIVHTYDTGVVNLQIFAVTNYEGTAACHESQMDLRWTTMDEMADLVFPAANHRIRDMISTYRNVNSALT